MPITNPTVGQVVKDDYGLYYVIVNVASDGEHVQVSLLPVDPSQEWSHIDLLFLP